MRSGSSKRFPVVVGWWAEEHIVMPHGHVHEAGSAAVEGLGGHLIKSVHQRLLWDRRGGPNVEVKSRGWL